VQRLWPHAPCGLLAGILFVTITLVAGEPQRFFAARVDITQIDVSRQPR